MSEFKPGEIAVITGQVAPRWAPYVGTECEIICVVNAIAGGLIHDYQIRLCDGLHVYASAHHLRRRPPPKREDLGEWELCPWQPTKVTVGGQRVES